MVIYFFSGYFGTIDGSHFENLVILEISSLQITSAIMNYQLFSRWDHVIMSNGQMAFILGNDVMHMQITLTFDLLTLMVW